MEIHSHVFKGARAGAEGGLMGVMARPEPAISPLRARWSLPHSDWSSSNQRFKGA